MESDRPSDLAELAERYGVEPSLALGLGAGLYFEYLRRPAPSPTHSIRGLHRELPARLEARLEGHTRPAPETVCAALHENALWFNLDRSPTTALLGMEVLAEELPGFARHTDWRECLRGMAHTVSNSNALYRRTYAEFLLEFAPPITHLLANDLYALADEWDAWASVVLTAVDCPEELERAGSRLRRLALREEHFWGQVMELTVPTTSAQLPPSPSYHRDR